MEIPIFITTLVVVLFPSKYNFKCRYILHLFFVIPKSTTGMQAISKLTAFCQSIWYMNCCNKSKFITAVFMGIYKRANGVYYVQLNIGGKKIQKSLKTKNHILAKDLYHVILREHLLKNWFTSANMPIQSSEQKQLKTEKIKQTPNFINWYYKYLEHCKTLNLGKTYSRAKRKALKGV